jgi:DNA-binding transcriptional LysR family regulator
MPIDPSLIAFFSSVSEHGSVSRAADHLGVSPSTVSRKIEEAELDLGVRLFDRDTRHLRLTEAGRDYLHYVHKALYSLELGEQNLERYNKEVTGVLKVWCPPAFGRTFMAVLVAQFGVKYPALKIALQLEAKPFALGSSDFDVGVCVGMPSEGRVVISKIASYRSSFLATPKFFERYGVPRSMAELIELPVVEAFHEREISLRSAIRSQDGDSISYAPKLSVNDSSLALSAILSDEYIGKLMHWFCEKQLISGELQKALPSCSEDKVLYTMVQARKGNPRKVQLFVDFLKSAIQNRLKLLDEHTNQLPFSPVKTTIPQTK